MAVKSQIIVNIPGLKVVKLSLSKGDIIPEHSTNAHVVVTTLNGEGANRRE